ncbi:MAG: hypothetical protein PHU46_13475 [Rhodocyclaceae bacterium]|nr:hypothetical protein [Rhodocyclaceae bacterium]
MMGFGSFITGIAKAAGETALNSGRSVANWTAEQAEHGYQAYQQAKGWVGEKADEAYQAYEGAKDWAGEKAKEGVADGLGAGMAAKQKASAAWKSTKEYVGDKLQSAEESIVKAVDRVFGRKGELPAAPPESAAQACPLCESLRKKATREARRELVAKGKDSADSEMQEKAEELERDMDAVEEAKLSDHIYCIHDAADCSPENAEVPGFKDVSNDPEALDAIGLKPADLRTHGSNFRTAVFLRENPPFAPEEAGYVVVFKGTSPDSTEDWQNNFRQGLNAESPYYKRAVTIGSNIQDAVGNPPNPRVRFAGHSLGGGLASAAAKASGLPANTFNAAGLNPATVARYGGNPSDAADIRAYHVPGDPLTEANEKGLGVLGWKPQAIQPPLAAGTGDTVERALRDREIPKGKDDAYFHSMPVVIRALERRKGADEERLRSGAKS